MVYEITDNTGSVTLLNGMQIIIQVLYPDSNTSTWWTTNDATWEMTGLQLEGRGSQAHRF